MEELTDAMAKLDRDRVMAIVDQQLAAGTDPLAIVESARKGLELVGDAFDDGDYFLMELMWAAEIFKDAMASVTPVLQEQCGSAPSKGTIVLGTVAGDVHDLGKNIVKNLLECSGYTVVDLGVDVSSGTFVQAIKEHQPQVVGLSALLTAAIQEVNNTVDAISDAGLRGSVKLIVGGGIVGEVKRAMLSADYATTNANEGTRIIAGWIAAGD